MRFRPRPLRQSAVVAAVFVAVRVVYYAVFGGADGAGRLLIALPTVTLPAPFSGVLLLGPVTSGGLAAAAASALPFAAVIVGFGVLNACFDVRPWLAAAARRGPASSITRAVAIAWQLAPALGLAVRRARRAARLRGERPGPSTLVPVLEGAIERAVALAASLELRGFAATRHASCDCAVPVRVTDASLSRPGWSLSIPSLTLAPGSLTVLSGPTGAGKSSVLDALSGLFQHVDGGRQSGSVRVGGVDRLGVPPRETAGFVGAVAQRVRLAFVGETVAEEIGYALALRGVAPVIVADRVREVAERLGIAHLVPRPIDELSAGEAELVALAAATVERPTLLLVDEPLAELDAVARPRVVAALGALAHEGGVCVVVAEHRTAWFDGVADGWLTIEGGVLGGRRSAPMRAVPSAALRSGHHFCGPGPQGGRQAEEMVSSSKCSPGDATEGGGGHAGDARGGGAGITEGRGAAASVHRVDVRRGGRLVVDGVSLELRRGELVALVGPNGAGKSSLLGALALPDGAGRVFVRGADVHAMRRRERHAAVALVPEEIEDLFVTDSVRAECRRADRHAGAVHGGERSDEPTLARFATLAGLGADAGAGTGAGARAAAGGAAAVAEVHPRDLSGGQRVCLAIALQLAARPAVLLIDEPVRGLDPAARAQLAAALLRAADAGAAVLFATHEHEFAAGLAARTLRLEGGRIASGEAVRV